MNYTAANDLNPTVAQAERIGAIKTVVRFCMSEQTELTIEPLFTDGVFNGLSDRPLLVTVCDPVERRTFSFRIAGAGYLKISSANERKLNQDKKAAALFKQFGK